MYIHILESYILYWLYTYIHIIQLGSTALDLAAQEGRVNIVRLLIEAKAQINIQRTVCIIV